MTRLTTIFSTGDAGAVRRASAPDARTQDGRAPERAATVDVACTDCVRLCFDGFRSKPSGLVRDGVAHATPLDGPDVPLCELEKPVACPACNERMAQHAGTPIRAVIHGGLMHIALLDDTSETALCAPTVAEV